MQGLQVCQHKPQNSERELTSPDACASADADWPRCGPQGPLRGRLAPAGAEDCNGAAAWLLPAPRPVAAAPPSLSEAPEAAPEAGQLPGSGGWEWERTRHSPHFGSSNPADARQAEAHG